MTVPFSHREKDDCYKGEIARHGRFRVVICKDSLQWILQRQRGGPEGRWVALGYCVTQNALSTLWTASTGGLAPELVNLPEHFGFCGNG